MMAATPSVTVVIVNFNGGEMVVKCLEALHLQTFQNFATIVVDNHSSDGSRERVAAGFPTVTLIALADNLGFAAANNVALRGLPTVRWVALLNPDAYPDPEWLATLMAKAEACPEYAAFGSKMFCDDSRKRLDGIGDIYHVSGLPWRRGHGCLDEGQFAGDAEIFGPCAAAALYSMSALATVGFMDEDFFCYIEDVDLAFRLRLAGYRSLFVHNAVVTHVGSGLVGKHSDFQLYHGHRNLVWAYIKNMPGALFWVLLPLHIAMNVATVCWFVLKGKGAAILGAKRDAIRGIPSCLKKRRLVQANRKASAWSILRRLQW